MSWETIFGAFWGPEEALWHYFGCHLLQGCTQEDPWVSKDEFLTIFDGFWVPHGRHFWVTFCYFMCFEVSKSRFGLQARFLMISDAKICWFWCPNPAKNIVNAVVFIRFHVFDFLLILMVSGTSWELNLEVFGGLQASFWGFLRVLESHWFFIEFCGLAGRLQGWDNMVSGR